MNSLKKPETAITLINTAALLGASIYFYRKTNNLELELNKHSEHLTLTVKKVKEIANTKKHIATLADAIKKLNHSLSVQNGDVESLKEIVKYQNLQIAEMQKLLVKEDDSKNEIKLAENPHLQAIMYRPQYGQFVGNRGQGQQGQQGQEGQYGQQGRAQPGYPPRQQIQQPPTQAQPFPGQTYGEYGQRESLIDLDYSAQGPGGQQYPRQGSPNYPGQNRQPQQQQFAPPQRQNSQYGNQGQQNQGYGNQGQQTQGYGNQGQQNYGNGYGNQSYEEEDEDAAIDAVRRARQQQNADPLDLLL